MSLHYFNHPQRLPLGIRLALWFPYGRRDSSVTCIGKPDERIGKDTRGNGSISSITGWVESFHCSFNLSWKFNFILHHIRFDVAIELRVFYLPIIYQTRSRLINTRMGKYGIRLLRYPCTYSDKSLQDYKRICHSQWTSNNIHEKK